MTLAIHEDNDSAPRGDRVTDGEVAPNPALDAAIAALHAHAKNADPFDLVRAECLLAGYDARWAAEMANLEVLAVEREFACELVNPLTGRPSQTYRLGGKMDAIARDLRDGRVLVVEHKTSSEDISQGSEYWRRLRMDGQVSVYYVGAGALGFDVGGCLYDVIGKPALRPFKATPLEARKFKKDGTLYANQHAEDETPAEFRARLLESIAADPNGYYQRGDVARLEQDTADALLDIWQLGQELRESANAGRHPRNPDACTRYGRTCEFFDVCSRVASIDDPARFRRVGKAHAELSDAAGADLLTSSRLKAARSCRQLHHFRYVEGYAPAQESEAARFGTLIHAGLEAWWRSFMTPSASISTQ